MKSDMAKWLDEALTPIAVEAIKEKCGVNSKHHHSKKGILAYKDIYKDFPYKFILDNKLIKIIEDKGLVSNSFILSDPEANCTCDYIRYMVDPSYISLTDANTMFYLTTIPLNLYAIIGFFNHHNPLSIVELEIKKDISLLSIIELASIKKLRFSDEMELVDKDGTVNTDYDLTLKLLMFIDIYISYTRDRIPSIKICRLLSPHVVTIKEINKFDVDYIEKYVDEVYDNVRARGFTDFKSEFESRFCMKITDDHRKIIVGGYDLASRMRGMSYSPDCGIDLRKFNRLNKSESLTMNNDPDDNEYTTTFNFVSKVTEKDFLLVDTIMSYLCGAPFAFPLKGYTVIEEEI